MAKQSRLSQVIAIEKQVKSRVNSDGSELHKLNQKPDLFNGMNRTYERKDEDGEDLPGEQKLVQQRAAHNLQSWARMWTELLDVVATKDWGNMQARADLEIEGTVLVKDAPVTYLIWLEKQLDDCRTFVDNLPVLDPGKAWKRDPGTGLHTTDPVRTARHKKVPRVLLKVEASEHHPAQAEVINDDVLVGYWSNISTSGAFPEARKRQLLERLDALRIAVKQAREEANSMKVDQIAVGTAITSWILRA
jgi:hypothetical protein